MNRSLRTEAVGLVRQLVASDFASEADHDAALRRLEEIVPDPRVSDLIFWPDRHELSAGIDQRVLTPEVIVDLAMRHQPFAL